VKSNIKFLIIRIAIVIIIVGVIYTALINLDIFPNNSESDDIKPNLSVLRKEVKNDVKEYRMIKRLKHRDMFLKKENFTQISDYQKYVTPDNPIVQSYISNYNINTIRDAYSKAIDWIWVSDITLHNKFEYWLLPASFISVTPNDPDNPVPGNIVSDCEEHAFTLVSLLEIIGISKDNVRVVIGKVEFEGETGGHAWVQVYENNVWFELEATSGPFWDDDENSLVDNNGFPFSYFKTRPYPVEEYWAFFNDKYYYNPDTGQKSVNLPPHWLTTE
jgi:hypothetical protein